jgi:cation:H+ antiporter
MEIFVFVVLLVAAIWGLTKAGSFVVVSLSRIAHTLRVSEFFASFVLMSLATSLPELFVGISSALSDNSELALGNALGTTIVNLGLILGVVAVTAKGIRISEKQDALLMHSKWIDMSLIILPIALLIDGTLSRPEGGVLILLFIAHLVYMNRLRSRMEGRREEKEYAARWDTGKRPFLGVFFRSMGVFIVSVSCLLGAAALTVYSSNAIAETIGIPELLIGIFILGLGTSLPELVFGVKSARSGVSQASLGNLLGASIVNMTLILGIVGLINPFSIGQIQTFVLAAAFVVAITVLAMYALKTRNEISMREGLVLVSVYAVFLLVQIFSQATL